MKHKSTVLRQKPSSLKAARVLAGLRQRDLAALVEVDAAIISRLENGIILPGEKIRRRLAAALGVPEDFLSIIEEGKADD